jgi:L-ascorbate metabolism protein UlaG (beta-lactamase superfamily)
MDAADALTASNFIECNKIVAMHFDTFGFIKVNHEYVKNLFEDAYKKIKMPTIDESFEI